MDDESGEFMERAEVTGIGNQSHRWRDRHEAVREKQDVDSRDEVKHNKETDQLFVKVTMKVDRRK